MRYLSSYSFGWNMALIQERGWIFKQDFLSDAIILLRTKIEFAAEKR
jgi:hypothetical protein